jgi:hypothetical protein
MRAYRTQGISFARGCGHPEVLKAFGFAVDALGIQRQTAFGVDTACLLLAFRLL